MCLSLGAFTVVTASNLTNLYISQRTLELPCKAPVSFTYWYYITCREDKLVCPLFWCRRLLQWHPELSIKGEHTLRRGHQALDIGLSWLTASSLLPILLMYRGEESTLKKKVHFKFQVYNIQYSTLYTGHVYTVSNKLFLALICRERQLETFESSKLWQNINYLRTDKIEAHQKII